MPLLVCGFPRSRTAWFAAFLKAVHEPSIRWRSYEQAVAFYRSGGLSSDATQTPIAARLLDDLPDLSVVVIDRPRAEVIASARRLLGFEHLRKQANRIEQAMADLRGCDRVHFISYHRIDEAACAKVWDLAHPTDPFDPDRYRALAGVNIQMDLGKHFEKVKANRDHIGWLFDDACGTDR